MSRILLLILFLLWLAADETPAADPMVMRIGSLVLFAGGFLVIVLAMALWSRWLAMRVTHGSIARSLIGFNRAMGIARAMIPAWFAVGIFLLGWHDAVAGWFPWLRGWEAPLLTLGLLPPLLAWAGLWWAQYPADRALREQSLLIQLNEDLPIHAPPGLARYMTANLRLQMLFTVVPVMLILIGRDLGVLLWLVFLGRHPDSGQEMILSLSAAALVFIFAPQILRYVLDTTPLRASDLRVRLEAMCRRYGLKYRDILLWRTHSSMGNAAVVGLIPQLRYILMSDLLLETMSDEQIEAVFAHEMGHIVHRHMGWYVLFFATLLLLLAGPGDWISRQVEAAVRSVVAVTWVPSAVSLVLLAIAMGLFVVIFGYVSRRFERQADVFAARHLELSDPDPGRTPMVGPRGSAIVASALQRVAAINNIPLAARSWCHGSLLRRIQYVLQLGGNPLRTTQFDQAMRRLYLGLILALLFSAAYLAMLS